IYAATFSDKNRISDLVDEYNSGVSEENRIKMTDYVKLLMSSISTVINAITYVLIAFVGISLVVSSIMIGVITNISVLERIKEIGILRAIGASKGDIRRVFNAETFIIGLLSGVLGILVTLVLLLPINIILHYFTGISYLNAALPVAGALILILLSMALTIVAGLIPAHSASKKDPVVALRYE
ncbi:MAG: FtsX-like permease family protein, partial [Clostridia bacterium]|nr:FtsX-like permease family protein [Clostridia bacterium]